MSAEREMTLDEWVGRLPEFHLAHRQYTEMRENADKLTAEIVRLRGEVAALLEDPDEAELAYRCGDPDSDAIAPAEAKGDGRLERRLLFALGDALADKAQAFDILAAKSERYVAFRAAEDSYEEWAEDCPDCTPQPADGGAVARSRRGAVAFLFDFIAEYDEHEESEWSPSWRALAERARELCEKHATEIAGKEAAYLAGLGDDPRLDGWAPDTRPPAAPVQAAPQEGEAQRHAANEWADMAINGVQWLRNIRDGISTADEALAEMESNLLRVRALNDAARMAAHPSACELGAVRELVARWRQRWESLIDRGRLGDGYRVAGNNVKLCADELEAALQQLGDSRGGEVDRG